MVNALLGLGRATYRQAMSRTLTMLRHGEPHRLRTRLRFQTLKRASRRPSGITAQDLREFLMAYCACFMTVSAFIA